MVEFFLPQSNWAWSHYEYCYFFQILSALAILIVILALVRPPSLLKRALTHGC